MLYGSRHVVLLATAMGALLLAPAISESRPRCKFGQIFRQILGICQSKMAESGSAVYQHEGEVRTGGSEA